MSKVYVISDLHFGHRNICKYRPFDTPDEHDAFIMEKWDGVVTKNDIVYVLGDAAFTIEGLHKIMSLKGRKFLVRGNHDSLTTAEYLMAFDEVYGLKKYKHTWLSHAPIHPDELRGVPNIHGHTHQHVIDDPRYVNVCVEQTDYTPVDFAQLRAQIPSG
jgi:calcineurin-like phosphoesterase family protein